MGRLEAGEAGGFAPNPTELLGAPWPGEGGDARGTCGLHLLSSSPPSLPAPQRRAEPRTPQLWGWGAVGEDGPGPAHPHADARGGPSSADEAAAAPRSPLRSLQGEAQPPPAASSLPKGFLGLPAAPLGAGGDARAASPFLRLEGFARILLGVSSLLPRPK